MEQSASGDRRRQLETRSFHPRSATANRGREVTRKSRLRIRRTMLARSPARSATRKSTNTGEKRRWQMSFVILANIPTPSFLTLRPILLPSSRRTMSRWFTAAFGSSVISRKGAMIIFRSPRSGMLHIGSGVHILSPRGQTGGSRFTLRTICSGPRVRPATDAIRWTTTSTRNRWRSGTWDAKNATVRGASMSSIPLAATF